MAICRQLSTVRTSFRELFCCETVMAGITKIAVHSIITSDVAENSLFPNVIVFQVITTAGTGQTDNKVWVQLVVVLNGNQKQIYIAFAGFHIGNGCS